MTTTHTTSVFDGKTAVEHAHVAAEAVRAINHLTYHDTALPFPADVWRLLNHLATVAHRLPQALQQTDRLLARLHGRGAIGIDVGTDYDGGVTRAVGDTLTALRQAEAAASDLAAALDRAAGPLTYAHHVATASDTDHTTQDRS
jgi:hypothetical protein